LSTYALRRRVAAVARLSVATLMNAAILAQAPPPVHPTIAPARPGLVWSTVGGGQVRDTPLWNRGDGVWNQGEGWGPTLGGNPADRGGFLEPEDLPALDATSLKVYVYSTTVPGVATGWHGYTWTDAFHPSSPQTMRRCVAFLRPPGRRSIGPGFPVDWGSTTVFAYGLLWVRNRRSCWLRVLSVSVGGGSSNEEVLSGGSDIASKSHVPDHVGGG
jgi:hypothetical protein